MRKENSVGKFVVRGHFELSGRGAFVVGTITEGTIKIGMAAGTGTEPKALTVSGVEFIDNLSQRTFKNALAFAENPTMAFIKQAFPVGSVIEFVA